MVCHGHSSLFFGQHLRVANVPGSSVARSFRSASPLHPYCVEMGFRYLRPFRLEFCFREISDRRQQPVFSLAHFSSINSLGNIYGPDFSAPILESLYFHADRSQTFMPGRHKLRLSHLLRLQEIQITNVSLRCIRVPRYITRVYADGLPIPECGKILRKCRSLVHCELSYIRSPFYSTARALLI